MDGLIKMKNELNNVHGKAYEALVRAKDLKELKS